MSEPALALVSRRDGWDDEPMTPRDPDAILTLLHAEKETREQAIAELQRGHTRHTDTLKIVGDTLDEHGNCQQDLRLKITRLELKVDTFIEASKHAKVEVSNLRLTPSMMIAIIVACFALYRGYDEIRKGQEMSRVLIESLTKTVLTQGRDK